MVSVPLPPCDADALTQCLYEKFAVEVPVITWKEKQFVRVSVQGYNTRADVDALVSALTELLPEVTL
jgi:isopenicillin-N epimerase